LLNERRAGVLALRDLYQLENVEGSPDTIERFPAGSTTSAQSLTGQLPQFLQFSGSFAVARSRGASALRRRP
jgi:hypothetical protein